MMRARQRQRRHLWESLRESLSVLPFTRAFLKSPSSRGLSAIAELLVSLVSNSNLNSPKIVVQKWTQLQHSRPKSIDKLPLLSVSYIFNRGCRPNLLAIIAAQKAQSIQRSVRGANESFYKVSLQQKKHAPLLPMSAGLTVNKSIRAEECGHAHRCTRKLPSRFLWQQA